MTTSLALALILAAGILAGTFLVRPNKLNSRATAAQRVPIAPARWRGHQRRGKT